MDLVTPTFPKLQIQQPAEIFRPAMMDLETRRRETAAVRERWFSLARKRQKIRHHSALAHSNIDYKQEASPVLPAKTGSCHDAAEHSRCVPGDLQLSSAPQPIPPVTQPSTSGAMISTPSSNLLCSQTPLPYHTAITRRPLRTYPLTFRALTQVSMPLPQLMDSTSARPSGSARSCDIQEWWNQIVKVVPERPPLVLRLLSATHKDSRYPYKIINFNPTSQFYRSWSKVKDKDYVISPEWASEKFFRSSGGKT